MREKPIYFRIKIDRRGGFYVLGPSGQMAMAGRWYWATIADACNALSEHVAQYDWVA